MNYNNFDRLEQPSVQSLTQSSQDSIERAKTSGRDSGTTQALASIQTDTAKRDGIAKALGLPDAPAKIIDLSEILKDERDDEYVSLPDFQKAHEDDQEKPVEPEKILTLEEKHRIEFIVGSGVHPDLVDLNVISLTTSKSVLDYLLISPKIERTNTGRVVQEYLTRYNSLESGWFVQGYQTDWGCLKPDNPRTAADGKLIKYEHPPKMPTGVFLPKIPPSIRDLIARMHGIKIPKWAINDKFWEWYLGDEKAQKSIPLHITEGAKKCLAMLSMGLVCLGISGIWNATENALDSFVDGCVGVDSGLAKKKVLHHHIAAFAKNRDVIVVFDASDKIKSEDAVLSASKRLHYLFKDLNKDNTVKFARWEPKLGKGIDDVLVSCGGAIALGIIQQASDYYRIAYEQSSLRLSSEYFTEETNTRFLPDEIQLYKRLFVLNSAKGTGKTQWAGRLLKTILEADPNKNIIYVAHRTRLCKQFVEDLRKVGVLIAFVGDDYQHNGSNRRLALCPDSLHLESKAQIVASEWEDAVVILDECEQNIAHLLFSTTFTKKRTRVPAIETLSAILKSASQIVAMSADIDNKTVRFLCEASGLEPRDVQIYKNTWADNSYKCTLFAEGEPSKISDQLILSVGEGKKVLVACSSKSGAQSPLTWVLQILQKFPDKKCLAIDADTIRDINHPAYKIFVLGERHLLFEYDVVLYTSCIGTGVSINHPHVEGFLDATPFDEVFGIFWGNLSPNECRQMLMRYRPLVQRYCWIERVGSGTIGNGSLDKQALSRSENRKGKDLKTAIETAMASKNPDAALNGVVNDIEASVQTRVGELASNLSVDAEGNITNPAAFVISHWFEFAVAKNYEAKYYRPLFIKGLEKEGVELTIIDDKAELKTTQFDKEEQKEIHEARKEAEDQEIASPNIPYLEEEQLKAYEEKGTHDQNLAVKKTYMSIKLGDIDITAEIAKKYRTTWKEGVPLKLHYYSLPENHDELLLKDIESWQKSAEEGEIEPDRNRKILLGKVALLNAIDFYRLLTPDAYHANHSVVKDIYEKIKLNEKQFNDHFNLRIDKNPMKTLITLADKLALDWVKLGKITLPDGSRVIIHSHLAPAFIEGEKDDRGLPISCDDGRQQVFDAWSNKHKEKQGLLEEKQEVEEQLDAAQSTRNQIFYGTQDAELIAKQIEEETKLVRGEDSETWISAKIVTLTDRLMIVNEDPRYLWKEVERYFVLLQMRSISLFKVLECFEAIFGEGDYTLSKN